MRKGAIGGRDPDAEGVGWGDGMAEDGTLDAGGALVSGVDERGEVCAGDVAGGVVRSGLEGPPLTVSVIVTVSMSGLAVTVTVASPLTAEVI